MRNVFKLSVLVLSVVLFFSMVAFAENEALEASDGEQQTAGANVSAILTGQF